MSATGKDIHVDVPLSNIAIKYTPTGMIGGDIAPVVNVGKQSNSFPIWSIADAYQIHDTSRAPGTEANKIVTNVSTDKYFAKNWALKNEVTAEDLANADDAFRNELFGGRVRRLRSALDLDWERRVATAINTSTVGSSSGVNSGWASLGTGTSDPVGDIESALNNIQDATGVKPNRLIIPESVWRNIKRHADVISAVWGTSGVGRSRNVRVEQFTELLELEKIFIARAYYNTADEGQTANLAQVWGDNCLAYFNTSAPSLEEASFMYSMRWAAAGLPNMQAERHPFDPKTKSEEIELGYYQDEKITAPALGYLLLNCNSYT
jgi:hypothetical protein